MLSISRTSWGGQSTNLIFVKIFCTYAQIIFQKNYLSELSGYFWLKNQIENLTWFKFFPDKFMRMRWKKKFISLHWQLMIYEWSLNWKKKKNNFNKIKWRISFSASYLNTTIERAASCIHISGTLLDNFISECLISLY